MKEDMKEKHVKFLNFVNDLVKLKIRFDEFKLMKFKKKVLSTAELINKTWILEKIVEFSNKN